MQLHVVYWTPLLALAIVACLVVVAVLIVACLALYVCYIRQCYSHLPSPRKQSFFFGHAAVVSEVVKREGNVAEVLLQWYQECGPVYVWFVFVQPFVVAVDPTDIEKVCSSHAAVSKPGVGLQQRAAYVFGERLLGSSFAMEGDCSRVCPERKQYEPFFSLSYLQSLVPQFSICVDQFLEGKLRPHVKKGGKEYVPMDRVFNELALELITLVVLGSEFKSSGKKEMAAPASLSCLLSHVLSGVLLASKEPYANFLRPAVAASHKEATRALRRVVRDCIRKRAKAIRSKEDVPSDILSPVLKTIISTEEERNIEELVDDFVTFYFTGQEPIAVLCSFALAAVLQHPGVLQRLRQELAEVMGDNRGIVTAEDLTGLTYLEQVVLESLRLYPPVPMVQRVSTKHLRLSGFDVPKRTTIMMSPFLNGRLEEHFQDPLSFDPDRFSPDVKRPPNKNVYFPFYTGHRACLGKNFAMLSAKLILAQLLQAFDVELSVAYKLELRLQQHQGVLRPAELMCTLTCRAD